MALIAPWNVSKLGVPLFGT